MGRLRHDRLGERRLHALALGRRPAWLWRTLRRLRLDLPLVLVDALLVIGSFMSLLAVRFDGSIPTTYSQRLFTFLPLIVAIHLTANLAWGLYGPIWRHASVAEARLVVLAGLTAGAVVFALNPLRSLPLPRSVALLGAAMATMSFGLVRFQSRLFGWRRRIDREATRVAVVGAGSAGAAILRELRSGRAAGLTPVVVIDDDPRKQGRTLAGVPVVRGTDTIEVVVEEHRVHELLLAIPDADRQLVGRVARAAELAQVPLKVLPPTRELLRGQVSVRDARRLRIDDLLGRLQVSTDLAAVRGVIQDRCVLVTGAGGSIGSEVAVQVAALGPARLVLLDHDETHLHDLAARLPGDRAAELVLADIRDRDRLLERFADCRPDVVFHVAAHKHVPMLEDHPLRGRPHQRAGHRPRPRRGRARSASGGWSSSPPTRRCGRATSSAGRSGSASSSPAAPARPAPCGARCASATCSAAGAAWCRPSPRRSPRAVRSRSPTRG